MRFSQIIGHQTIKDKLIRSVKEERVAHAQLFLGAEGTAALPLTLAYAQFVNCLDPSDSDSCGTCSSCVKYDQLVHPDLHLSFPTKGAKSRSEDYIHDFRKQVLANPYLSVNDWMSSLGSENSKPNITADECRSLIKKMGLKPYESAIKVLVIWMPEYLGKEGNILLKLIEEPPGNALIVLCGQNEERLLGTILSRVQLTRVPYFGNEEVAHFLTREKKLDEAIAANVALMSDGNMNKALKMLDNVDNPYFESFRAWMLDCYKGDSKKYDHWVKELSGMGREPLKSFLDYGLQICRACLVEPYGLNTGRLTEKEQNFVTRLSGLLEGSKIERFYSILSKAQYAIERNGNAKIVIINLSLDIHSCFTAESVPML